MDKYGKRTQGNLTTYTDVGGTTSYSYNTINLLTSLTEPGGAKTTYTYDTGNRQTSMVLPTSTGITVTSGYDNANHKLSVKAVKGASTLMNFAYAYRGNLKSSATDLGGNVTTYSYDALNRLTDALTKTSGGVQSSDYGYTYDGAGNRLTSTANGVGTTYSYNFDNELIKSTVGNVITTYSYDGNGNLTGDANRSYTIDQKNQTTKIDTSSPTTHNSYSYSGATQTDRVQVNGIADVFSALGLSIEGKGSATPVYYTRTNAGGLLDERTTTGAYYSLMDDLGSVANVVDSTGAVKNSYRYDPFGNSTGKTEVVSNPWQFASGYLDANTGLYKFGERYYDPALGRWTQKDPVGGSIGNVNSTNPYVYADNLPNMLVDPSGASPSPAAVNAALFTVIAAGCALLTVESVASILGIPASPFFALCAGIADLFAAIEGLIAILGG